MPDYVLNRSHTHVSTLGRSIAFKKGEPTHVPQELVREVVGIGAEAADGTSTDVLPVERSEPPVPVGTERETFILKAFDQLVLSNNREDFTGNNMPSAKAVARLTGWSVDKREIDKLWHQAKAEA